MQEAMTKPVIIVSGLGRCGSSLTMQMLHAAGLKCAGEYPAFEPEETNMLGQKLKVLWCQQFEAIKILDPHRGRIPNFDYRVIWVDRDRVQQAVSQVKFAVFVGGLPYEDGAAGRICRSLLVEREQALNQYAGKPRVEVSFEDAIDRPSKFCGAVADLLWPEYPVNVEKMMACVRKRKSGVLCAPGLDMELSLIEEAKSA